MDYSLKSSIILISFLLCSRLGSSQSVTNLRVIREDKKILVLYDLFTAKSQKQFYIRLLISEDSGKTFKEVQNASGDVRKMVSTGANRIATIEIEKIGALTANTIFKIHSYLDKETLVFSSGGIEATLKKAQRVGNSVNLIIGIKGFGLNQVIIGNFVSKDTEGNFYRDAIVNNRNSVFNLPSGIELEFPVVIENAGAVDVFDSIDFKASSVSIRFTNVAVDF